MDGTAPPLWAHLRKLTALFLGLSLFSVGFGLLMSVVALRLAQQGHDELTVGGVNAAFYLGGVIGSVYCAGGLARVGHVRTFAAYAALLAVATLAHTLWLSAPAWAILRLASGFCFYGLLMTVESWLNERANESGGRGRILGVYMVLYFLSYSAGQLLLNLGPGDGGRLFALSAMLIAASLVPVALTRIAEPGVVAVSRFELRRLLHLSRLAVAGAFLGGLMQGIFLTLGPVYGLRIGLDVAEISMLMTAGLLGGLAFQWPLGWVSDLVSRRLVIAAVCVLTAASAAVLALDGGLSTGVRNALVFLCAGGFFSLYPLCLAHANDYITAKAAVEVNRSLIFIEAVGSLVAPVVGGALMRLAGPAAFFGAMVGAALIVLAFAPGARTLPSRLRSIFVPMPSGSTYAASSLDPRRSQRWTDRSRERREAQSPVSDSGLSEEDPAEADDRTR